MIRRGQVLRHVEVVLGELAPVGAGDRDRRHVVQRRVEAEGEVDDRPGALDVGGTLVVLGGGHVVDGGAVHDMVDGPQFGDGVVGQPESRGGEVADQRFRSLTPGVIPVGGKPLEPAERLTPDQNPHLGVIAVRQDLRHHTPANKPGTAGNDILHASHGYPWRRKRQCCVSSDTPAKGASMPLDPNAIGAKTEPQLFKWTDRDTMLYALGVGAGLDDLAFTTENSHDTPQQVLPTYAVIACLPFAAAAMIGSFNFAMLLHGSQGIRLFKPLPAAGKLSVVAEVADIQDKGEGKNAIVMLKATGTDPDSGEVIAETHTTAVIRGEGGFGGQPGQRPVGSGNPGPRTGFEDRAAHS